MILMLVATWLSAPPVHASVDFEDWTFYLGEPHQHTALSGDGNSSDYGDACMYTCGALSEVLVTAQEFGLDWLAITEHVLGAHAMTEEDFEVYKNLLLEADAAEGGLRAASRGRDPVRARGRRRSTWPSQHLPVRG